MKNSINIWAFAAIIAVVRGQETVCDNAPFRRVARIDDQYTLCDKLIPAAEEKVNRNGELTLKCDLQSSSLNKIRCIWRLPDGITECEVPDASEEDDCYDSKCYCANDNTVRYLGNTREHNCNIRIEEANFDRHNGTWSCIAEGRFIDTVNVTVTTLTEAAVLGLAIGIPLTVLLILLIIILLICILCPAVCAVCLCCGGGGDKEDSRRRSLRRAEDDWPPSGLEGGRSRNVQPVQIVRTPQHAVRQESYQQRSSYPVYETPSYENGDGDYYSSSGSPDYARPSIGASAPPPPPKHQIYEPVVSYTRAIPTRNEESARTARKVSNMSTLQRTHY